MYQVLDYVKERASLYELNKTVRMWERKVEIAEVKSQIYLSELNDGLKMMDYIIFNRWP